MCQNEAMKCGETHSCRAILDGYAGCGCPQCSGDTVIVPEADLGLSWGRGTQMENQMRISFFPPTLNLTPHCGVHVTQQNKQCLMVDFISQQDEFLNSFCGFTFIRSHSD